MSRLSFEFSMYVLFVVEWLLFLVHAFVVELSLSNIEDNVGSRFGGVDASVVLSFVCLLFFICVFCVKIVTKSRF